MTWEWFTPDGSGTPKSVALVVHGLNLNPAKMKEIITVLNEIGIEVLLLSLQGHGHNFAKRPGQSDRKARLNAFRQVTYQTWKAEIQQGYESVSQRASQLQCPLFFVGYSLGGLMGCDLMLSAQRAAFEKMILFAPAIATHRIRVPFLRLFSLFPRLVIPSISPEHYRSNRGTPVAGYLSLLQALRHCKTKWNDLLNIPTVVFIDKKDELVSYPKLKSLVKKYHLHQWTIHKIERHPHQLKYPFHHLIIDAKSAGQQEWTLMREKIIRHLSFQT